MRKRAVLCIMLIVCAFVFESCSVPVKDVVLEKTQIAWQTVFSTALPTERDDIYHIHFNTRSELASAMNINEYRSNFSSSGLIPMSGDAFEFVLNGVPRYVVILDADDTVTWAFDIQSWYTKKGNSRLSKLEFQMFASAIATKMRGSCSQAENADSGVLHKLTQAQKEKIKQ